MNIGIIGLGALGSTLARRLQRISQLGDEANAPDRLILWTRSRAKAERFSGAEGTAVHTDLDALRRDRPDWLFLTLPDDELPTLASQLAEQFDLWSGIGVIHTSGWLSSEVLQPVSAKGAAVASMHPIQTFTVGSDPDAFAGVHISLEGDPSLCESLDHFVRHSLGAKPFRTDPQHKRLLHAAAVFASNAIVPALAASRDLLAEHGFPQGSEMMRPLIESTIANIGDMGDRALSGPIRRGDLSTVLAHLQLLSDHPAWQRRYALLSLAMLESIDEAQMDPETMTTLRERLTQALAPR